MHTSITKAVGGYQIKRKPRMGEHF